MDEDLRGQRPEGVSKEKLSDIEIPSLDRLPRFVEPPGRENFRSWFAGMLFAAFLIQILAPLFTAIFLPERLDNVLRVTALGLPTTGSLLGAIIGFYFGSRQRAL